MAGQISDSAVIWNAGETYGRDQSGASVTISGALPHPETDDVTFGNGAPTDAPAYNKGPIYVNSANHKLYAWDGSNWIPASGFNT